MGGLLGGSVGQTAQPVIGAANDTLGSGTGGSAPFGFGGRFGLFGSNNQDLTKNVAENSLLGLKGPMGSMDNKSSGSSATPGPAPTPSGPEDYEKREAASTPQQQQAQMGSNNPLSKILGGMPGAPTMPNLPGLGGGMGK